MLKKEFNNEAQPTMHSNIINLNTELESRKDHRALTPRQELTIQLRHDYNQKISLMRAIESHKLAYKHRVKEYVEVAERIELQEERLLRMD